MKSFIAIFVRIYLFSSHETPSIDWQICHYDKRGLYNTDLHLAADFEIMLRFLGKFKISTYYLEEPLVRMRLGGASNNSLKGLIVQNIQCIKAFKLNNLKVNIFTYPLIRLIPKLFQFMRK